MLGYSALLGLGLVVSAPWWLLRMATSQRYREGLGERLGRVPDRLRAAVAGRRVVWVHAVSVGEVLAVSRLVGELETALNARFEDRTGDFDDRTDGFEKAATAHPMYNSRGGPWEWSKTQIHSADGNQTSKSDRGSLRDDERNLQPQRDDKRRWQVVISTTTRTGQALARERFGAARVFYLPLDFAWAVRAYLRVLRPALVVLAESEIWPRLLSECEREGAPVAVVNARVSDRSFRRARQVRAVWGRVLRKVSLWQAQSDADARRLVSVGATAEAVQVSGNLKFDVGTPKPSAIADLLSEALAGRRVIVAGSTVEGEEELVLGAFDALWRANPQAFLLIAPRHPERFAAVLELAEEWGAVRATSLTRENVWKVLRQDGKRDDDGRAVLESNTLVVVLDTIGDLAAVYRMASVAFVGGSLVARGGHNPLEPAQFGVPVVMGPSYENFRGIVEDLKAADAIRVLQGPVAEKSKVKFEAAFDPDVPLPARDQLASVWQALMRDREAAEAQGERGRAVFLARGGAAKRTADALLALLHATPSSRVEALPPVVAV